MARIKHSAGIEEMPGAHSKDGIVERRKIFRDYDGNVTKVVSPSIFTTSYVGNLYVCCVGCHPTNSGDISAAAAYVCSLPAIIAALFLLFQGDSIARLLFYFISLCFRNEE